MNKNIINTCLGTTLLGLASVSAQAASIWLQPTTQTIGLGEIAILEMYADASDVGGFLRGGLDLSYDDTIVSYNGDFDFVDAFPTDRSFRRTGDDCSDVLLDACLDSGEINGIAFGSSTGLAADGPTLVGMLSFTGISSGVSPVTMADNDNPIGPWYATDGSGPLVVDYGSAEIHVVPVPAAAWLFGTGLLGLIGIARRRK